MMHPINQKIGKTSGTVPFPFIHHMTMKQYKIEVDVLDAVRDFYPGLSDDDACKIAESIVNRWDYTQMYDSINDDITWYGESFGIDLEGKDGVIIETADDVQKCIEDTNGDYASCVDRLVESMVE